MFDQTLIRICLIFGSLVTAWYILRRVRQAKVQIEDTIFWLLFSAALLILAIFPGIAYWAANLLGFMSPINFVYVVIIFLLLAKQFFMSIRLSQLDSKVRILTEQVALNEEKAERDKLDLGKRLPPLGGSCQRLRPLTDEGRVRHGRPLMGNCGKAAPHPALWAAFSLGGRLWGCAKLKFVFPQKLCYNKVLTKEKEGLRYGLYPETDL